MPPELAYPEAGRIGTALLGAASKGRLSGTQGAVRSLHSARALVRSDGVIHLFLEPPLLGMSSQPSRGPLRLGGPRPGPRGVHFRGPSKI